MDNKLFLWRAVRQLNLVQAALLAVDADPQEWESVVIDEKANAPSGFKAIYLSMLHDVNTWSEQCDCYLLEIDEKGAKKIHWSDGGNYHVDSYDIRSWLERNRARASSVFFPDEPTVPIQALDKNSPTYPPELDLALQAWRAVSATEGKGKPKARIRAWLDINASHLSNDAKKRISILANWDKKGGATRAD